MAERPRLALPSMFASTFTPAAASEEMRAAVAALGEAGTTAATVRT